MLHDRRVRDGRPVLVVEDSDDDFDTVIEAARLAAIDNHLVRAADGDVACRLLGDSGADHFAFMLLDYNLLGMDGLSLLKFVRSDAAWDFLPMVVFTTSVSPLDRIEFQLAGASAFHVKSVEFGHCLHTLRTIFDRWLTRTTDPQYAAGAFPVGPGP
jgi:two-component system, chemotaxis family, chemotaxis protein CheY